MARVTLESDAIAQFGDLPAKIKQRMVKIIERLHDWPTVSGARPLRGDLSGNYRIRTGDHRLQFHVEHDEQVADPYEVVIVRIGHRDGFYEE